ncbi:MAG: GNAT family N-acetyltransferase [Nitrospirae bacterium GWC2_42_7]|nr:MAG: GNAT family N-acetyltransferase [Nitrospirae bacterium GWC2_42_7]HBO85182.1 GNAT family N-acetyltransferase [Deltaproteobacteria bacterium]
MLKIAPLSREHDRAAFDCGVAELNAFLKATARQHGEKGLSRTFVLTESDKSAVILGFFTLALCEITAEHLPPSYAAMYPKHSLPAVRLARLAVSLRHQGKGYGSLLVAEAVHRTILIADQAGNIGMFVDAKNARARDFYKHYGFVALPGQVKTLFLPLKTLRDAIKAQ